MYAVMSKNLSTKKKNMMETFNPAFFRELKEIEKRHFWFRIRRRWISDKISRLILPPAEVLEIGCGTGNVSKHLSEKGYKVTGCEYFPEAIENAYPGINIVKGDAKNLPFNKRSFDIVCLFDVIEHFDNDKEVLFEACRVVKQGGIIAITIPARKELWSYFDEKSYHKRRYSKEDIRNLLDDVGLKPISIEYMFSFLYLPMMFRKIENKGYKEFQINPFVNDILILTFELERIIAKLIKMPIGTSIFAIGLLE